MTSIILPLEFIDFILILIAVEAVAFSVWARKTGRESVLPAVFSFLLAGAALTIAVRFAMIGGSHPVLAASLAVSGVAHAFCLFSIIKLSADPKR
ncbi:MAG: hypothetical protein AAFY84_13685 [Pseudomonadota bacterium]